MQTTFHRAFDMACDLEEALEAAVAAGCRRILTSGGRNTAVEGIDTLRALVAQAAGRIELMAGSGVNPSNVRQLAATGVDAVHFSARSVRPGGMVFRNPHVSMGGCGDVSEYDLLCVDERLIRQILTCSNHETHHLLLLGACLCTCGRYAAASLPDTNRC